VQYNFMHDTTIFNYSNWGYVAWNATQLAATAASGQRKLLGSGVSDSQVLVAAAISNDILIPDADLVPLTNSLGSWIGDWTGQYLRVSKHTALARLKSTY
jgi:hypothetical protein